MVPRHIQAGLERAGRRREDLHVCVELFATPNHNPAEPIVITVGSIHGGTQGNIIPDEVKLELSVRTLTPQVRTRTLTARDVPSS